MDSVLLVIRMPGSARRIYNRFSFSSDIKEMSGARGPLGLRPGLISKEKRQYKGFTGTGVSLKLQEVLGPRVGSSRMCYL